MSITTASKIVLAIVLMAALFCVGWIKNEQSSKKTTWEYKFVDISSSIANEEQTKMLNQSGADGWELVQAEESPGGPIYCYFKRAK
jgi:hypothetical protein